MQRDEMRKIVSETVQKSLLESGVTMSAIPSGQLAALVNALSDGVFAAFAAMEEEDTPVAAAQAMAASTPSQAGAPAGEEKLLWRGRPYLTIGTVYELTTQRLRILRGVLGNQIEEIELIRVRDTKVKQHVGERLINVGDITIISADNMTPTVVLNNVSNPIEVRETIRKAVQAERQRRGVSYREVLDTHDEADHHTMN